MDFLCNFWGLGDKETFWGKTKDRKLQLRGCSREPRNAGGLERIMWVTQGAVVQRTGMKMIKTLVGIVTYHQKLPLVNIIPELYVGHFQGSHL